MAPEAPVCLIRGGGDLATGVAWRLTRAGWQVIVTELPEPLTVRRTVALSSAVREGTVDVEGMEGRLAADGPEALEVAKSGSVAVLVSPELPAIARDVVIDARLAKRNIDTTIADADLVIGLGPGFAAGTDCHAVIETLRGHHLGRVLWSGAAAADTGTPGVVGGKGADRVLRAPEAGAVSWDVAIGETVSTGQTLGAVAGSEIRAPFDGVLRGLIAPDMDVRMGLKIGDLDPRSDPTAVHEISDKALAIGGGVVEAIHTWLRAGRKTR